MELDKILYGGFENCCITEIFGEYKTGKTQFCHMLCVTSQLTKTENKILYIDTEQTFQPERLKKISDRYHLNFKQTLENITIGKAYNPGHQFNLVKESCSILSNSNHSLLIIDSCTSLYRSDYDGRGELSIRQQHLAVFLRLIQKIAIEYEIPVIVTNQVVSNLNIYGQLSTDNKKAVGGNIMGHATQLKLYLKKHKRNIRVCKIHSSPWIGEKETLFTIDDDGLNDA
jgi:DNA repair protein RAD51